MIDINGSHFDGIEDYPTLAHGDVDKRDITKLSTFLKDMVGTGILIPDEELEDYVRRQQTCRKERKFQIPERKMNGEKHSAERQRRQQTNLMDQRWIQKRIKMLRKPRKG